MNKNRNGSDFLSWFVIIFFFAVGGWPIALFLLFRKLFASDVSKSERERREAPSLTKEETIRQQEAELERLRKKVQKKNALNQAKETIKSILQSPKEDNRSVMLLTIAGALVMAFSLFFAFSFGAQALAGKNIYYALGSALAGVLGGGSMLASGIMMKRALQRYSSYLAIIGPNDAMEIETVARKAGVKRKTVERDLQKMIEKGYFGDSAYINKELGYLFRSSRADEELAKAREAAREKTREASKKEAARQNAVAYDQILEQIRDVNERIPDEAMTEKINQIESITREIFRAVEQEPEKRGRIDRFMSYFLPTTLKLLETYANLDKTKIQGKNISQSKRSIELAMDTVVDGFRHQLDELYKTDAVSIETEVDVLTKMINRETVTPLQEFGLGGGGQAVQTMPQEEKK